MVNHGSKLTTLVICAIVAASTTLGFHHHHNHHQNNHGGASASVFSPKRTMCFSTSTGNNNNNDSNDNDVKIERLTSNPLRLAVLRLGFTEPAWTSPLNYGKKDGTFTCAYCGAKLFDSQAKYDSGSGWPSFWRSIDEGAISYKMEFDGRLECKCAKCDSHLGHVFLDGPRPSDVPQDILDGSPSSDPRSRRADGRLPRFCINGACLNLKEEEQDSEK